MTNLAVMDIRGRHILVTGAGKRIGRVIAETLLPYGISLSAHYRNSKQEIEELANVGKKNGSEVLPVQADLENVQALRDLVSKAENAFGPVDILINSASDFYPTPVMECSEEDWDHFQSVNLKGQFFLAQACAKAMKARGGVMLNIADVNGERPLKKYVAYTVSKAGLLLLTRNLAKEWAPLIRVNSISPGPVCLPESYDDEQRKRSAELTLLKRLGSPSDIANAAIFLIQNEYITGVDLKVDGGRSLT